MQESESNEWNDWAKLVLTYIEDDKRWKEKYGEKVEMVLRKLAVFENELAHIAKTEGEQAGRKWGMITGITTGIVVGLVMLLLNHFVH